MYGYRLGQVPLPAIKPPKKNTRIFRIMDSPMIQKPVAVSLGVHVEGIACPHPDLSDTATTLAGFMKRVASTHPEPEDPLLVALGIFVDKFLQKYLPPLPSDSDTRVETWLWKTNYPLKRKKELLDKYYAVQDQHHYKYKCAKCFVKDEFYPDFKHARGIYSRTDEFKCFVGPVFKLIEEVVYKLKSPKGHYWFAKNVPVAERPAYIAKMLEGYSKFFASDYTAYESQFRKKIMEKVEFKLYCHMAQNLDIFADFKRHLSTISGDQYCIFKYFQAVMETSRLSGEMCTSLGNGFSNLMFCLFVATYETGLTIDDIVCSVEGDDSVGATPAGTLCAETFTRLGLTIKLVEHDKMETASFCGIIFDQEELINVTDPRDVLATFGWGTAQYTKCTPIKKKMLLRCKALSLAHQYPGCPIIQSLANYGLRVTREVRKECITKYAKEGKMNMWEREQLLSALGDEKKIRSRIPGIKTRGIVDDLYDIDISTQISIEKYLDEKEDFGPITHPSFDFIMPKSWSQFSQLFVREVPEPELNCQHIDRAPDSHWKKLKDMCDLTIEKRFARSSLPENLA